MSIPVGWFLALVFGVAAVVLLGQYLLQKIQIAELIGERDNADAATKYERERRKREVAIAEDAARAAWASVDRAHDRLAENRRLIAALSSQVRAAHPAAFAAADAEPAVTPNRPAAPPAAKKAAAPRAPRAPRKTAASS